ncbi:hypothetical protein E1265_33815 [Streptomyces sp. 8K308]|uniref:hypothetical protein n=1 Tax=Streptomyces sp. 8K308 TaxID=2530388 RepID=UPI00104EF69C|nr:hypothetical protein [Streptomyces sp. 8K308]TDC07721.1 hypothetical protein E1265_33815 [Streptomyces sp. 8K308]
MRAPPKLEGLGEQALPRENRRMALLDPEEGFVTAVLAEIPHETPDRLRAPAAATRHRCCCRPRRRHATCPYRKASRRSAWEENQKH